MKKFLPVLALTFAAFAFAACVGGGKTTPAPAGEEVTVIFASDLHLLAPGLFDDGPLFGAALYGADSKMTHLTPEITEAFIAEVIAAHPAALILGGDLTHSGEKESHLWLAEKLQAVADAGIPVLAIPGNHDLNAPYPYQYEGNSVIRVEALTPEEFKAAYFPLGADGATLFDEASLSYFFKVSEDLYILMLDASIYTPAVEEQGRLRQETLAWVELCLQTAAGEGAKVLSASHQNLLWQPMGSDVYMVEQAGELLALYEKYGVQLNLSGHIHVQRVTTAENGFTEITGQAMALYPCQYGVLDIGADRSASYHTQETDVAAWAAATGSESEKALNFAETGTRFFYVCAARKALESIIDAPNLTKEEKTDMADFVGLVNPLYFSGRLHLEQAALQAHPGYALWAANEKYMFSRYMTTLFTLELEDYRVAEIPSL